MKPVGLGIDLCRGSDHIFAGVKYSLRIRYKWLAINHSARKFPIRSYSSSLKTFLPTSTLAPSPEYLIARCWATAGEASIMIQFDHLSLWEIVLREWKWPNWLQRICREVFQLKSIISSLCWRNNNYLKLKLIVRSLVFVGAFRGWMVNWW